MDPFTAGICWSAYVAALQKADMKPSFAPCFFSKASLYSVRRAMIFVMSISLKVVSIARVFWELFRRSATRFLRRVMGTRLSRSPGGVGAAGALGGGEGAAGLGAGGAGAAAAGAAGAADAAGAAGAAAFGAAAPSAILNTGVPTTTVSFSATRISVIVPLVGARTSMVTLSVSICATHSSMSTESPTSFKMAAKDPSEIESPISGTATVTSAKTELEVWKARLVCERPKGKLRCSNSALLWPHSSTALLVV
mmetsp:Transcript_26737/g.32457  ORF Transcript_26737/g.32457 Transcript_26737/m.32457 type:complete len:252 (-) Transcript_26737:196-951(-)